MMHRNSISEKTSLMQEIDATRESIKITLFTSDACAFCEEAREVLKEAVERVSYYHPYLEVVESRVDKKPALTEKHQVLAVPTIFVAKSRIVGMPRVDDLEQLIHQEMLSQYLQ
ncbi:MAG: glutaredoxin family protein [Candidatus Thorarchaeota archaeon]